MPDNPNGPPPETLNRLAFDVAGGAVAETIDHLEAGPQSLETAALVGILRWMQRREAEAFNEYVRRQESRGFE